MFENFSCVGIKNESNNSDDSKIKNWLKNDKYVNSINFLFFVSGIC